MDNFFSEQAMIDSNVIDKSISALKDKGLIYTGIIDALKVRFTLIGKRESNCCLSQLNLMMISIDQ